VCGRVLLSGLKFVYFVIMFSVEECCCQPLLNVVELLCC